MRGNHFKCMYAFLAQSMIRHVFGSSVNVHKWPAMQYCITKACLCSIMSEMVRSDLPDDLVTALLKEGIHSSVYELTHDQGSSGCD